MLCYCGAEDEAALQHKNFTHHVPTQILKPGRDESSGDIKVKF